MNDTDVEQGHIGLRPSTSSGAVFPGRVGLGQELICADSAGGITAFCPLARDAFYALSALQQAMEQEHEMGSVFGVSHMQRWTRESIEVRRVISSHHCC